MTSPLLTLRDQQRRQILDREAAVLSLVQARYQRLQASLAPHVHAFVLRYQIELARRQAILDAEAAAEDDDEPQRVRIPASWLHDKHGGNWPALQALIRREVEAFTEDAKAIVLRGSVQAARQGQVDARASVRAALAPILHLLPRDAVK